MLFLLMPNARTRGNTHQLIHRRFPLNIVKCFFTLRTTKIWHSLPWEVVELFSLEILKRCLDLGLSTLLWVALLAQEVEQRDTQGPPNHSILWFWFCDSWRSWWKFSLIHITNHFLEKAEKSHSCKIMLIFTGEVFKACSWVMTHSSVNQNL